jgi:hypothetical protein
VPHAPTAIERKKTFRHWRLLDQGFAADCEGRQFGPAREVARRTVAEKRVAPTHPVTPDGRYFVVRGRLWRMSNPALPAELQEVLVKRLMDARRALRGHGSPEERAAARAQVEATKRALGERGPVWWTDGAPDFNRKMAQNTLYADWYASARSSHR